MAAHVGSTPRSRLVQRASRARLIRFLAFWDRGRQAWNGPLDGDTDQQLRDSAFVVADHWYVVRRERAFWRAYTRPVGLAWAA